MDKVELNQIPATNTALNMDGDVEMVQPTAINAEELKRDLSDEILSTKAKDILATQNMDKKFNIMLELKISNPDLKLLDFVRDYIGAQHVEGTDYYELSQNVEDYFFKKLWKGVKKVTKGVTKFVSGTVQKVVGKGGVLDKIGRAIDKGTGGIASKVFQGVKGVVSKIPVIGRLVPIIEKVGGTLIDVNAIIAEKTGKVDVQKIKGDFEEKGEYITDEEAAALAASIAMTVKKETGIDVAITDEKTGELKSIVKKSEIAPMEGGTTSTAGLAGIFKNPMIIYGVIALILIVAVVKSK